MSRDGNGRHSNVLFQFGDTVRLTLSYVTALDKNKCSRNVKWGERRGIVKGCTDYDADILWDHRKSVERTPVKALEKIT